MMKMTKRILKLLLINITLCISFEAKSTDNINFIDELKDYASGIRKINEFLFTAKKQNGPWLVMERIDLAVPNSRLVSWQDYLLKENECYELYEDKLNKNEIPHKEGHVNFESSRKLKDGLIGFEESCYW